MTQETIDLNKTVNDFSFTITQSETSRSFSDYKGKNIILYFYPKDSTPGCTIESKDFRDLHQQITGLDTVILGISRDTLASHDKFKAKCDLPFELITDPEEILCRYFDVIKDKSMFGKKVRGIVRSTFLIDKEGVLRREWRKVKVLGHAKEVFKAISEL